MSRIRSKDTRPELLMRSILHKAGYRFRLHVKNLPGKPDIVLPKHNSLIFVNGCFFHRHPGCKNSTTPKTNRAFWAKKFRANVERQKNVKRNLKKLGVESIGNLGMSGK